MFCTISEAELPISSGLTPNGERLWRWIELGPQVPYFLVAVNHFESDCPCVRHVMFSDIRDVAAIVKNDAEGVLLKTVSLLSPSYMNGTDSYQLGQVIEAWAGKVHPQNQMFIMAEGSTLNFSWSGEPMNQEDMELVFRHQPCR